MSHSETCVSKGDEEEIFNTPTREMFDAMNGHCPDHPSSDMLLAALSGCLGVVITLRFPPNERLAEAEKFHAAVVRGIELSKQDNLRMN